jgi:hypothetical protein
MTDADAAAVLRWAQNLLHDEKISGNAFTLLNRMLYDLGGRRKPIQCPQEELAGTWVRRAAIAKYVGQLEAAGLLLKERLEKPRLVGGKWKSRPYCYVMNTVGEAQDILVEAELRREAADRAVAREAAREAETTPPLMLESQTLNQIGSNSSILLTSLSDTGSEPAREAPATKHAAPEQHPARTGPQEAATTGQEATPAYAPQSTPGPASVQTIPALSQNTQGPLANLVATRTEKANENWRAGRSGQKESGIRAGEASTTVPGGHHSHLGLAWNHPLADFIARRQAVVGSRLANSRRGGDEDCSPRGDAQTPVPQCRPNRNY